MILDALLTEALRSHLPKIVEPIELVASLDNSPTSAKITELLGELDVLSADINVRFDGSADRRPSFRITRVTDPHASVTFGGVPLGHEFTSLVLALLQVGGHPSTADADLLDQIRGIEGTHRFETFFSLSCQNCPDVVQALNLMSIINPNIEHVALDGGAFQDEIAAREVMAVPTVFRNGEKFGQGRMTLEELVAMIDSRSSDRAVEKIAAMDPFDVLIVGGGPAGSSAAVYAARKGLRTAIVAERFGGQLLDTMGIENLISTPYTEGPKLAAELEENVRNHQVEIITAQRAERIDPAPRVGGLHALTLESGAALQARSLIISTGARWRRMGVPGEAEYANRGVAYCPHCDGPLYKGKRTAVIGGGNSGVEAAIDLAGIVKHVTLLEFADELRADDVLQNKLRSLSNVTIVTGAMTTEVLGDDKKVTALTYRSRADETDHQVDLDGIFVQIGLLPNTEWLDGTVQLSEHNEIMIDGHGATSVPGVFAAGDCTTVPFKQIVVSMGAGSTAMLSVFDHLIRTPQDTNVSA
ncbi:MAG: alkyl hydroperoxide reductase subunit F [Ilumatobacter sp.]|mgnify:FL=1|jgi:alkyl hydroperoxide reductase subunit F|tara:strand:+ start:128 stop:1711 length:1584 start_codon:yes stop_codon:yes gene_type:complete